MPRKSRIQAAINSGIIPSASTEVRNLPTAVGQLETKLPETVRKTDKQPIAPISDRKPPIITLFIITHPYNR
jgi:hypothetical protein